MKFKLFEEFKEFAIKGNMIDIAIGVIIGGAFNKVVNVLVKEGYGKLFEAGIDFLVITFTVFIVVKLMNSLKKQSEDPKNKKVVTPKNIELMNKTNELLEKQNQYLAKVLGERK